MDAIPALPASDGNPLLGNWLFSALSFLSYNMMAAITILVPLTRDLEDESTIRQGLLLGSGVLTVIFVCILMPMLWFKSLVGEAELPMLALASRLLSVLGVGLPDAGGRQVLPRGRAGDAPHHGDRLPLRRQEAEDGVSVFRILKDDAMYGPLAAGQFFHVFCSLCLISFENPRRPPPRRFSRGPPGIGRAGGRPA